MEHTVLMYSTAYNLWTFTWVVHFELPLGWKGLKKFIPRDFLNSTLIYILFSLVVVQSLVSIVVYCILDNNNINDWFTGLLDYWKFVRWEITFVTFSASQYIFFVSTDSALS